LGKAGKGFVSDTLNIKGIPELLIPGYQCCVPFTKLDERLARGDEGINPLDAGYKEHDIAYRDNKDLENRIKSYKELEHKHWGDCLVKTPLLVKD
jgi:hypothetical protein